MEQLQAEKQSFAVETEQARIARWFSKDREGLPAYHSEDGNAYFVTRDEQDKWLNEAYMYAQHIDKSLSGGRQKISFLIFSFFFLFGPVSFGFNTDKAFEYMENNYNSVFTIYAFIFIGMFISTPLLCVLWIKDHFLLKFFQRRKLALLRKRIEKKVIFRDEMPCRYRRHNFYKLFGTRMGILIFLYGFFIHSRIFPYMAGLSDNMIIMSFGVGVMLLSAKIATKLDSAHVRQTGKWFRWPRRA